MSDPSKNKTENNNDVALHTIEICAGVGMLGEGLRAGLAHLGAAVRTVCYLEREAYPAACLAARIEEGSLDSAPVWSDLLTFDASAWRGAVDGIVAGFPCQDLSLAGKRAGLDGKRSGLFFNILDIADACGAWFMFLENVAGIASASASVVDEAEGALDERAAARVLGELADRGWHAEWLTLSASAVGASHGRERWFCFAWRPVADSDSAGLRTGGRAECQSCDAQPRRDDVDHPRCDGARERAAADSSGGQCLSGARCADVDDASGQRCGEARRCVTSAEHAGFGGTSSELADPDDDQHDQSQGEVRQGHSGTEPGRRAVWTGGHGSELADTQRSAVRRDGGAAPGSQGQDGRRRAQDDHGTQCVCRLMADPSSTGLSQRTGR